MVLERSLKVVAEADIELLQAFPQKGFLCDTLHTRGSCQIIPFTPIPETACSQSLVGVGGVSWLVAGLADSGGSSAGKGAPDAH